MSKLTTEEIEKIAQLLLSEQIESVLLGYELVKQNTDSVGFLLKELVLILMLHEDKKLTQRIRAFLFRRYKSSGQFEQWKNDFQLFSRANNVYSMTDKLNEAIINHEKIRADYQPLIEKNRHYAGQYFELARALHYYVESHFELCKEYYKIAIKANPFDASAWFNLGHLLQNHMQDHKESLHCYKEVLKLNPNMAAAHNNIGVILESEYQAYEEAFAYFEEAHKLSTHSNLYRCNLASLALKLGKNIEFEKLIKLVFASDRYYYRAMNQWANYLWEHKKEYKKAEEEYRKGLSYYPNDTHLLGNLGEMYADVFGRFEEALGLYEQSLHQAESLYRLTTTFSLLVLNINDLEKGRACYQKIKKLQAEKGKVRDPDLKDIQWALFLEAEKKLLA